MGQAEEAQVKALQHVRGLRFCLQNWSEATQVRVCWAG